MDLFQTLSHEPQVLKQGLLHLNEVLQTLEPLHKFVDPPGGSVLLRELANASQNPDAILSAQATPLLHALSAAHAYITMFTHVCKVGQVRELFVIIIVLIQDLFRQSQNGNYFDIGCSYVHSNRHYVFTCKVRYSSL